MSRAAEMYSLLERLKESDILYEVGDYWVTKAAKGGYEVYKTGTISSTRVARIGYKGEKGLKRAKAEADKRAAKDAK